jgi:hypothetical protein
MAFLAGHFFVGSVKFETSLVMVKFVSRPFFKGMTQGAVGCPFFFELAVMDILVAIGAPVAQSGELLYGCCTLTLFEMAGPATLTCMGTFKGEFGPGMVKSDVVPPAFAMAALAGGLRIVFFIEIGFVDVFMAIDAAHADVPETPSFLLLVADKTRRGLVGAVQGKASLIVFLQGEKRSLESAYSMAFRTIGGALRSDELAKVIVRMAIGAAVMLHRVGIAGFVA